MSVESAYDRVRYPDLPIAMTQPDRLAAIAALHGSGAPPPSTARVLDLGCGAGMNLIAIAAARPGVEAVGVDLAERAIATARAAARQAHAGNARFEAADVLDLTGGQLGEFDYVISHGVYSWVPPEVREALMAACASHLAPGGVAYISYNVHPGGHFSRALREAALWHARGIDEPLARARRAHELFALLEEARTTAGSNAYAGTAARALADVAEDPPAVLHHDILADDWDPVWFNEFAAHAGRHGLAHLSEAWVSAERPAGVEEMLAQLGARTHVEREQYVDILLGRRFRASLLTGARGGPEPALDPEAAKRLRYHLAPRRREAVEDPAQAAVVDALTAAWPAAVGFAEVVDATGLDPAAATAALVAVTAAGDAIPGVDGTPAVREAGARPEVYALARWQAADGMLLATLNGGFVAMEDGPSRVLVSLLDGTRDRDAIIAALAERAQVQTSREELDENLARLARLALLVA